MNKYSTKTCCGAVLAQANVIIQILNCSFRGNGATKYGGAIYTVGNKLLIKSSLFEYNSAISKYNDITAGGAIFVGQNSYVEIQDCLLKGT